MPRAPFIDHLTIPVRDVAASRRFYEAALAPFDIETTVIEGAVGFGPSGSVDFFIREGEPGAPVHIAFAAPNRATVDAFHAAALAGEPVVCMRPPESRKPGYKMLRRYAPSRDKK